MAPDIGDDRRGAVINFTPQLSAASQPDVLAPSTLSAMGRSNDPSHLLTQGERQMPIRTITFTSKTARALSAGRRLGLLAIACVAAFLTACAPVQQGNDQCKDINVNLVELKDAKYKTLPVAEGGLDP